MEMLRGHGAVRAKARAIFDAALLVCAIAAPMVVVTVYAMYRWNEQRPSGYPWQLVTFGGYSLWALMMRGASSRLSSVQLAAAVVALVLMAVCLVLFVHSSALGLGLGIERAISD